VIGEAKKPRYALAELLAQCDFTKPVLNEEQEWLDAPAQGLEDI
jgi:antitoxin component of MazEF toxin-antitoxin module